MLGTRWVYDASADPVYVATLAATVLTGGTQAEEVLDTDGRREVREPGVTVQGSGRPGTPVPTVASVGDLTCRDEGPTTLVTAAGLELTVVHVVGAPVPEGETLTARWAGGASGVVAVVSPARRP